MRDYGKVHSTFWSSETIQAMTEDGRLLGTAEELGDLDEGIIAQLAVAVLDASGLSDKSAEDASGN